MLEREMQSKYQLNIIVIHKYDLIWHKMQILVPIKTQKY